MKYRLSKSKYLSAFQCEKKLWLEIHEPGFATPVDDVQQAIFDQGHKIGKLAQDVYPRGVEVDSYYLDIPKGIQITLEEINKNPPSLYEGFFQYNDVLVRPDILVNNHDGTWDFIEVKSSTKVKPENIRDVAIQSYVLNGSGMSIRKSYLMHLNRVCVYPNLNHLFKCEDLSEHIKPYVNKMDKSLNNLREMLKSTSEPAIMIGQRCKIPYSCQFQDYCWKNIPKNSSLNLPGLKWPAREEIIKAKKYDIDEIPVNLPLTNLQSDFIKSYREKKPIVDWEAIRDELAGLVYPITFLDFETFNPAVPEFDGLHPYSQYPFQYSLHILEQNGHMIHKEYLHESRTDPRIQLTENLIQDIPDVGSLVAYHAAFEKDVLKNICIQYPEYENALNNISKRIWDQLRIFRKYYVDYRFRGTNSLKNVLPVLVQHLSYENLDVQNGREAQIVWRQMLAETSSSKKAILSKKLKSYCKQDTLAMVEIHKVLIKEIAKLL